MERALMNLCRFLGPCKSSVVESKPDAQCTWTYSAQNPSISSPPPSRAILTQTPTPTIPTTNSPNTPQKTFRFPPTNLFTLPPHRRKTPDASAGAALLSRDELDHADTNSGAGQDVTSLCADVMRRTRWSSTMNVSLDGDVVGGVPSVTEV